MRAEARVPVLALGSAGIVWRATAPAAEELEIERGIAKLKALRGEPLASSGVWSPAFTFEHCAQSVEYSMTGYPELKPAWFRHSVGPAAFNVFDFGRRMHHPLDEPIPGAQALAMTNTEAALERLIRALAAFQEHSTGMRPHFAFGELEKSDYARAHAMHLNQHLLEISIAA